MTNDVMAAASWMAMIQGLKCENRERNGNQFTLSKLISLFPRTIGMANRASPIDDLFDGWKPAPSPRNYMHLNSKLFEVMSKGIASSRLLRLDILVPFSHFHQPLNGSVFWLEPFGKEFGCRVMGWGT